MRGVAWALIAASFLAGAWISVQDRTQVDWPWLWAAVVPGIVGALLVRLARRGEASHEGRRAANLEVLSGSIDTVCEEIEALWSERDATPVGELRRVIDRRLVEPLASFVEARDTLGHVFGLEAYADVMSDFAAGERYLNRVWSASTDGYVDEALDYLERARRQFAATRSRVSDLVEQAARSAARPS